MTVIRHIPITQLIYPRCFVRRAAFGRGAPMNRTVALATALLSTQPADRSRLKSYLAQAEQEDEQIQAKKSRENPDIQNNESGPLTRPRTSLYDMYASTTTNNDIQPDINNELDYRNDEMQMLLTMYPSSTNTLFWNSGSITLFKSDFQRLLPPNSINVDFELRRSRSPVNLAPWLGYFLVFKTRAAATYFYQHTLGAELCGIQAKFTFVNEDKLGLNPPLLAEHPSVIRRGNCALLYGLDNSVRREFILQKLWDYEFVSNDKLALQSLPQNKIRYGGKPRLLCFTNSNEVRRLVREVHDTPFLGHRNVIVEPID